jgi:hypothetical protein
MMKCKACGKQNILVEGLGDGKKKLTCQDCGFSTVEDDRGRGLLTDTSPQRDRRQLLTG